MVFRINHIHLKTPDPRCSADWFVRALNFTILADHLREGGERFVRCSTEDGSTRVYFSNEKKGETLSAAATDGQFGIEHLGFDSADVDGDVNRLMALGARVLDGPRFARSGERIAFLVTPDKIRLELIQPPP
jgi:catechol 2,3-dioxygenase-like lactoylglutathione lyase family enzyme